MKAYPSRILLLVLLGVSLSLKPATAMELVRATDDTPGSPYIIGGGTSFDEQKPGIEIELYNLVAKHLNLQVTFKRFAWIRCLQLLESGHVDGIFPASYKPERMPLGAYPMKNGKVDSSRKTRDNTYYLYKLKGSPLKWDGQRITRLEGAIGVPVGWAIAGDLKDMGVAVADIHLPASSMQMLLHKRFAGLALLETVADAYFREKTEEYNTIVKLSPPLKSKAYYLMLSHQFIDRQPEMAEKIWNTIAEIMQTDAYKKMVARY